MSMQGNGRRFVLKAPRNEQYLTKESFDVGGPAPRENKDTETQLCWPRPPVTSTSLPTNNVNE
ncbi:hypothetical protein QC763_0089840 [Podospora pseudopauciseta]|uniref:Uncharacterized protein n=1 Tax=Podospora pseudopauciseta TaxID=2093780 RepID=A0ABR0H3J1_9PEZI|nr:hypothetical protein QC763_0089840 [Podospora pseudopauciseta]